MTADQAAASLSALASEIFSLNEQPVNRLVLEVASTLVDRHSLKSLDAVQLGCAMVARDAAQSAEVRFVSADSELLMAAQAEGFSVWNPQDTSKPFMAK
jgi:predicted nucleic acid-binding protein